MTDEECCEVRPNFYRSLTWQCAACGSDYHPCHPNQEVCGKSCAGLLRSRRRRDARLSRFTPLTIKGTAAVIPLCGSTAYAIVDAEDYPDLAAWKWRQHDDGSAYRKTKRNGRQVTLRMHRFLCGDPEGREVDHEDMDRLNNRRSNLREATSTQNKCNRRVRADSGSRIKGVYWDAGRKQWLAYITYEGRRVIIGRFEDMHAAIASRRAVARFIHGEFARETA